jgi:hypothetical protein
MEEREGGEKAGKERDRRQNKKCQERISQRENREERGMVFPKDLCAIWKNCRDLFVKQNFPSIQNSNEEMPKTKVGEFFKLYNIALGLKFKNSKLIFFYT